jgi:sec-independent protein translocase protein TatA
VHFSVSLLNFVTQIQELMTLGILLIFGLGTQEIMFIALIILLLFGGSKIPELMKGIGKGVRSFKEGMAGIEDELKPDDKKDQTTINKPEEKK